MSTSTAEIVTAPAPTHDEHAKRRYEISWFLKASINPGEAEAMASAGYKPRARCGDCQRHGCEWCDRDPAKQATGGKVRRTDADPRFVRSIVSRYGMFGREVVTRTAGALQRLPADERLVLVLLLGGGLSPDEVGRRLKMTRQSVWRVKERALERLVREVWG